MVGSEAGQDEDVVVRAGPRAPRELRRAVPRGGGRHRGLGIEPGLESAMFFQPADTAYSSGPSVARERPLRARSASRATGSPTTAAGSLIPRWPTGRCRVAW